MKFCLRFFLIFQIFQFSRISGKELNLNDCLELGLKNNIGIKIQKVDLVIQELRKEISQTNSYPDINAVAGYTYIDPAMRGKIELLPGTDLAIRPKLGFNNNYSLALQMKYVLYSGGKLNLSYDAANLGEEATKLLLKDKINYSKFEIKKAFINVLFLKEMVKLARESYIRSSDRLKDTELKFKSGSVTKIELLRMKAENSESDTFLSETIDRYKSGIDQLKLLLNIPSSEVIEIRGNLKLSNFGLNKLLNMDLEKYEPVFYKSRASKIQAKQAEKLSEIEKANSLPTVVAGVKADHANPYQMENRFGNIFSAYVQASMPVWNWGRNEKEYQISLEQKNKAEAIATEVTNQLEAYYLFLFNRINSLKKGLISREKNLERSIAARDATEIARKNGAATYNDWADTELVHFRLEVDYLRNLSDLYISYSDWERFVEEDLNLYSGFEADTPTGEKK